MEISPRDYYSESRPSFPHYNAALVPVLHSTTTMENVHKHSAFKQSCIYPPRQHPKNQQPSRPWQNRHRRRNIPTSSLGHDNDQLLHSSSSVQGAFNHELDHKFRSTGQHSHQYHRNTCLTDSENDDVDDVDVEDLFNLKSNVLDHFEKENSRFRSMADFYESIPGELSRSIYLIYYYLPI